MEVISSCACHVIWTESWFKITEKILMTFSYDYLINAYLQSHFNVNVLTIGKRASVIDERV